MTNRTKKLLSYHVDYLVEKNISVFLYGRNNIIDYFSKTFENVKMAITYVTKEVILSISLEHTFNLSLRTVEKIGPKNFVFFIQNYCSIWKPWTLKINMKNEISAKNIYEKHTQNICRL